LAQFLKRASGPLRTELKFAGGIHVRMVKVKEKIVYLKFSITDQNALWRKTTKVDFSES
jgi:hypothetical protein